ncbi:unnamed protein product, partial [Ixodes persulcatus]
LGRCCWITAALLFCLVAHSSGQGKTDFYTTVSTLSDLIQTEKEVKASLLYYTKRLKIVQDSVLNFVQDSQPYDDLTSTSDVFDYLKHPVHAFQLIKRMTAGLGDIETQIRRMQSFDSLVDIREMRKQRLLPWDEDFRGLAVSLVRLQNTYDLDISELAKGHLRMEVPRSRTISGRLPLSARDCLNISQVALDQGFYDRAVEWVEQAIRTVAGEGNLTISKQELNTFHENVVKEHDENLDTTPETTGFLWQTYGVPVRDRMKRSKQYKAELFQEDAQEYQDSQNYKRLCRGEQLRTLKMDSQLRCRYYKGQDGFFKLQPIKLEEFNLKPYIVVLHEDDVLEDDVLEDDVEHGTPRRHRGIHAKRHTVCVFKTLFCHRCRSTWLFEQNATIASRLNRHLRALLGMGTLDSNYEAEPYQLANYGTGGHYLPHHDYLYDVYEGSDEADGLSRFPSYGDRLATLMIYMSDVEEGGATVFPKLGVRLTPKKGDAVFWWNLKTSGAVEKLTQHAGCPVLYGNKWSEFRES